MGTVGEDRGAGLLGLAFSGLRVPDIVKVMRVQPGRERWSSIKSPVGLNDVESWTETNDGDCCS